ncbi:hypothetical protein RclHR1_00880007 [Rhizophagus clarus]|uniref:BAR domain-containing protein n=1 Tax=Rhizophagus clarus TaxID=94130 RepID=A0A2Z6S8E3_9GLOM|nr:hypothetical protein RclHR1_00880007 [Rhizophagus clarus]GES85338.1 hypothetical protein BCR41DRAFT_390580 [Rhizophagus clarus]
MALQQKKRFTFFGSPPMSPILSPTKTISNYFSSQEKQEDKLPNAEEVRKAVDNLERLVVAAETYRDLINKLTKASKTFSKTLKDYGNSKGMENVHVMCFQTTSQFYENQNEIQSKLNKALQKDFDSIQKFWDKYSKRVAKDEKAHNDYVGDLDKQLKKMSKDYEKKTKKESKSSLESHNQYMNSVSTVGSEIARSQKDYAEKVVKREKRTHSVISQIVCKLAEGQFAFFNESLKKCGPSITKMKEWAPFAGEDMPAPQSLDSFLEDHETQSQSDKNSTISERNPASIASISEKQLAAMNFSQESKLQFSEEPENIIPKYVQIPEPKHPIITNPETTNLTYARPNSLIFDNLNNLNIYNLKNDENTSNSSPTSSVPSTPKVQPTPTLPVYTSPFDLKSISRISIGVRDNDNLFLRDEKVVEVNQPEVFMESKVERNLMAQNINNQFKNQEEKSNESQNVTNDTKKNDEEKVSKKKDDEKKGVEKKDDEKKGVEKKDDEKKGFEKKDEKKGFEKKDSEKKGNEIKVDEKKDDEKKGNEKKDDEKKGNEKKDDEKKGNEKKDDEKKVNEKKDTEKKVSDSEKKGSEKKDNETSIKLQDQYQPEKKDIFTLAKHSPLDNIIHNRKSISDDSNTTLNDDKKSHKKSNEELKIEENKTKKSNEIDKQIKLTSRTIHKFEEKETTNKRESLIDKLKINDDSLYKPMNQQIPSENPRSIPVDIQYKSKEILLNNSSSPRSSLQISKQSRYDDYREEYSREDTELYNNEIRINEMNRYPNRERIYRDESILYNNSSALGERMRYNDANLNYHRTQHIDDDYESYDYTPSQNRGPYVTRDESPPRASLTYTKRPYGNSVPMTTATRSSSVREMTNRFQSMNEERRTISPSTRNIPIQTAGRVSEMTSRFGERRHKRDEIINPIHINNSRNGYEDVDDRYNEPIEYRNDRYIQYEDDLIHDGMTPVPHCNCHNCRMAIENSIIINSNRLSPRHNNPAPFDPRIDSNFMRKNYR